MRNLIILLSFVSLAYGCVPSNVVTGFKIATTLGCVVVTEESRAEIRDKQKVKTNICGDELQDE